jgi:hypothetical protein
LNIGCSYSFFVALQDGTSLDFYDANLKQIPIPLKKGDMIIWMGNQFHGGSEYKEENTRLFGRFVVSRQYGKPNFFYYLDATAEEKKAKAGAPRTRKATKEQSSFLCMSNEASSSSSARYDLHKRRFNHSNNH